MHQRNIHKPLGYVATGEGPSDLGQTADQYLHDPVIAVQSRPIAEAFGSMRGQIDQADDFDVLPADFEQHFR